MQPSRWLQNVLYKEKENVETYEGADLHIVVAYLHLKEKETLKKCQFPVSLRLIRVRYH